MENRKNWYLICTKSGYELKVGQALSKMNVVNYIPIQNRVANSSINKRIGNKVLFPSFVFVFANEQDHSRIRKVDNVLSIMFWLNKPVVIKSEEIASIQDFLRNCNNVTVEKSNMNYSLKYPFQFSPNSGSNLFEIESETQRLTLSSIGYTLTATSAVPQLLEVA